MNVMFRKIITVVLFMLVFAGFVFAEDRFMIVLPGEQFTAGTGKQGTPDDQTAGVPFVITVYSVDDSNWSFRNTNATVDMSASESVSFSSTPITLNLSEGGVFTCKQYVTVTANTTATGTLDIYANDGGGMGISSGSASLTVRYADHFHFETISTATAGQAIQITITVR
ncbi:MAG TPA: hypothetical protein ENN55_01670, partial [Firmicutes bacterium]|nr:hypothetical protein [Bacillota bacterium]